MKTAIVYYSMHHGNTKKIVDAISKKADVTLIDAAKYSEYDLCCFDRIGFASGIYFQKFSEKVIDFLEQNLPDSKEIFYLYTYGIKRKSYLDAIEEAAKKKHAIVTGAFGCRGFDTFGPFKWIGGIAKGRPDQKDVKNAVCFFEEITK